MRITKFLISKALWQTKYKSFLFCGRKSFFLHPTRALKSSSLKNLLENASGCQKSCKTRKLKIEVYLIGLSSLTTYHCSSCYSPTPFCFWDGLCTWDRANQNHVTHFWHILAIRRYVAKVRNSDRAGSGISKVMLVLERVEYLCSSAKGISSFEDCMVEIIGVKIYSYFLKLKKSNIFVQVKICCSTSCWF